MMNDTGEGILKEPARYKPDISWEWVTRPTNAPPRNAAGKGGLSTRPGGNVADKGDRGVSIDVLNALAAVLGLTVKAEENQLLAIAKAAPKAGKPKAKGKSWQV